MLFNLKTNLIVLTITFLMLVGFIDDSDAIEIVELRGYNGTNIEYDRGITDFTFYVRTNEPYGALLWTVDGEWEPNYGILR